MDLRSRLRTLIAVRVAASTVMLGSAIAIQISRPGAFPIDPFFFLIGLTYALSVAYLATLRYVDRAPWLVDLQFGGDAVLVSAFIFVTGGITSHFSSLYLLPIIATSTIRFRRGAMQVASLSAVLYLGLVSLQYLGPDWLPADWLFPPLVELPTLRFAQYTVGINLFGFMAVALLSGSLAEGLRSAGARLEDASLQIADLRAFNEDVINSLLSGLITTDGEGRILTFNRAAAHITGVPQARAVGQLAADVMQLPEHERTRLTTLGGETRSLRIDLQYRHPDARPIDLGVTVTTLAFPNGHAGYLFTFQDVTDVRRLEHDARLQQRLAAVGEMAAGIAHEIRNPLASMSGSIQVLRQELPLSEEQAQLMDIVLRESERLNDTIRSFLAYARPQRLAVARLDIRRVVQDTALLLRNSSDVRDGHVVDVEVPDGPVWYEADENQMRQVVWNLATNGLRAMAGGGRLLLSASVEGCGPPPTGPRRDLARAVGARADETSPKRDSHEGGSLESSPKRVSREGRPAREESRPGGACEAVLTVQDEGCGIPADQLDGIFQPFRSSFERGTGLGLAIVHRIVTDYRGSVHVSSAVGVGTTVSVRLPMGPGATEHARVTSDPVSGVSRDSVPRVPPDPLQAA